MAEAGRVYPLVRRRRRQLRLPRVDARRAVAALVLTTGAVLVVLLLTRPAEIDPRRALAQARAALAEHRWSAARDAALRAGAAGEAQLILARAYLELGDGLAAEAAAARAQAAGIAPARLHHLRAEARLLQGDEDGAMAEAGRAPPAFAVEAARVRARALASNGQAGAAQQVLTTLLASDRHDASAWSDLGRIRFTGGEIGAAAEAAQRAVSLDGRDPAALTLQGELVRARYGLAAALPWFGAAVRRDPGYHPALVEQAATLGEMGRYREMLAATRRALVARPGSPQALYLQAVLAARAGRPALARSLLAHTGGAIDDMPGVLLLGGALDMQDGANEAAAAKLRQLVDAQPFNLSARRLLGAALLRSGDAAGSLAALGPMAGRGDTDAYALELASRALAATADRAGSARLHDRAMRADPGPAGLFASDIGIGTLQAEVAAAPASPARALALIRGLAGSGAGGSALTVARRLATASPGAPAAALAIGDVLLTGGDPAGAAGAFGQAANLRFDEPGMLRLVDALGRSGRGRDAAAVLATYLSQNPDSVAALRLAGHWQVAARQWPAAVASLERVRLRVGNRDAALLADLALAHAGRGEGALARRYGEAAYRLAPANPGAIRAYAAALRTAGAAEGARQLDAKAAVLAKGG